MCLSEEIFIRCNSVCSFTPAFNIISGVSTGITHLCCFKPQKTHHHIKSYAKHNHNDPYK